MYAEELMNISFIHYHQDRRRTFLRLVMLWSFKSFTPLFYSGTVSIYKTLFPQRTTMNWQIPAGYYTQTDQERKESD